MTRSRLLLVLGAAAYMAALQWIYPTIIVPAFNYAAMSYRPQSALTVALQFLFACLPATWLSKSFSRPSEFQCWVLYMTVIVPSCILPYHVTALPPATIHVYVLAIIACFGAMCWSARLRALRIEFPAMSAGGYALLLSAITVLTYGWLYRLLGWQNIFLPTEQVYELRTELRSANIPALLGYLIWWQGLVVNPIISALGFVKRRWTLVILSAVLQVQLYSVSSLRTFLAAMAFQLGIGVFMLVFRRRRGLVFLYALTGCSVAASVWYFWDPRALGPLLFLERWIFNGGQLSGLYLEFFSNHAAAGITHSSFPLLSTLFPGPYDLPIGQVIGREYFFLGSDGVYTNATAHLWADGFAVARYPGLIGSTLVAIVLLRLADHACRRQTPEFTIMAFSLVGMSLIGQSVLTTVMTGGFAPFVALMLLMPRWREPHRSPPVVSSDEKHRPPDLGPPAV